MTELKFTLRTESYLLLGSGEGDALIDADAVFHKSGFPFVPGRRLKGLLKESVEEVIEIIGGSQPKYEIIEKLFGKSGGEDVEGIQFPNLYLKEWGELLSVHLKSVKTKKYAHALQPAVIKKHYSTEIQQTALDEHEIAKDGSLRNYRVLLPNIVFEGTLTLNMVLTEAEETLLKNAALQLRRAGTRRNRGFGKIQCSIEVINTSTLESDLKEGNVQTPTRNLTLLPIQITTLSPVVLAMKLGDQNTVFTQRHISGNQLRGFLAGLLMRKLNRKDVHLNPDFYNIILSGKVNFGTLRLNDSKPLPLNIHSFKGYKYTQKNPINVFEKSDADELLITKPIGGYGKINSNGEIFKSEPSTSFSFHGSRENRAAGRSTKDQIEGGIFYYEALEEDQSFSGVITSEDSALLDKLKVLIETVPELNIGKSRSAQYGKIKIECMGTVNDNSSSKVNNGDYLLTLQSHLILLNEYGAYQVNEKTLKSYLVQSLGIKDSDITISQNVAALTTNVEQFNSVWQSKSGKVCAFKEGSVFKICISNLGEEVNIPSLGEWQEQGFGNLDWKLYADVEEAYSIVEPEQLEPSGTELELSNATLKGIVFAFDKEKDFTKVKTEAINYAGLFSEKGIKGHLISRMEQMLKDASDTMYITKWLEAIKDKPAEVSLEAAGLKVKGSDFHFDKHDGNFEHNKIYWLTFFQTLRKMIK